MDMYMDMYIGGIYTDSTHVYGHVYMDVYRNVCRHACVYIRVDMCVGMSWTSM